MPNFMGDLTRILLLVLGHVLMIGGVLGTWWAALRIYRSHQHHLRQGRRW
jgi:hypothetical protein